MLSPDDPWSPTPPRRGMLAQRRLLLDARVAPLRGLHLVPDGGWIRTARTVLVMTTPELARRAGPSPRRVLQVERAEPAGQVRLDTLRRLAGALECELVYAFVPETSFDELVLTQAMRAAPAYLGDAARALGLEDVPVTALGREHLELLADQLARHRTLWRPTGRDA